MKGLIKQGTAEEKAEVGFSLSGSTVVVPGQTLPFFLTMTDMNRTAAAEITFEVDQADFVKNGQVTGRQPGRRKTTGEALRPARQWEE